MVLSIDELLVLLHEDAPYGDITTTAVVPDTECRAEITAKEEGVVAGLWEAGALFSHFGVKVEQHVRDGAEVHAGAVLMTLDGKAHAILLIERTSLNLIGHMSGIATTTRRLVQAARKHCPGARVAATRKTCPGLRGLDKKAVGLGGGDPHRFSLSDQILIKDNHLALVPLKDAIISAKKAGFSPRIEVEVTTPEEALMAAKLGAEIIMLDNMTQEKVRETLDTLTAQGERERCLVELSGGIDEQSIARYAGCRVDIVSSGAITHSAPFLDVSLTILPAVRSISL